MSIQYFMHDGVRLAYEVHMPKGATQPSDTVVLVMGTGSPGRVWNFHQVPALVSAGYRVVTLTNRGVAPSAEDVSGFTIDDMAADVVALIRHLGCGPVTLVGTSLGARIVTEVALAYGDLVTCVVAMAAHARLDPVQRAMVRGEIAMAEQAEQAPVVYRAAVDALQYLSPATRANEQTAQDWLDMLSLNEGGISPGHAAQLQVSADLKDRRRAYQNISVPVLALAFADDVTITPNLTREVADAIPNAVFADVPNAGHYGYLEQPTAVNDLMLSFLKSYSETPINEGT